MDVDGLVLVDKPADWTSHDVVGRMRRLLGTRKVGHGGTLDPMATGLLVIAAGKATRLLTYYSARDKDYVATIRLGASTVTDDAQGEVTATTDASAVTDAQIEAGISSLKGEIMQRPSSVSAIKVDGKRAYSRVREGEDVVLASRPVTVSRFDVLSQRRQEGFIDIDVFVTVSSGTYVRALARDLGEATGVGGHLTALRRTGIGGMAVDAAKTVEQLTELVDGGDSIKLVSLAEAAAAVLPVAEISVRQAATLGFGQQIEGDWEAGAEGDAVALCQGKAIAIIRRRGQKWAPAIVFEPASGGVARS